MRGRIWTWAARVAALALMLSVGVSAWAGPASASGDQGGDRVVRTDGTVLEGEIVREVGGAVWIKHTVGGIEHTTFVRPSEIASIERGGAEPAPADPVTKPRDEQAARDARTGTPRAAVLTLEGMVGMQMSAKPLEEAIPLLEADGIDVVVLRVNSGGGFLLEIARIQKVIHEKYKEKFRVVAWIDYAISAAAMSSHVVEEIVFFPQGAYGACTGWSGALVAVKDRELEEVLAMMEQASVMGQYDPAIMRAMQIDEPLTATIDENGDVHWYNDDTGEYTVNPKGQILTFDSAQATQFKFAKGVANTIEELQQILGYPELEWVGEDVEGVPYPVSRAERLQRKWRDDVTEAESRLNEYFAKYQISVANAQSEQDEQLRGRFVGRARGELAQVERAAKEHPNIALLNGLTDFWFSEQHRLLRELMRR